MTESIVVTITPCPAGCAPKLDGIEFDRPYTALVASAPFVEQALEACDEVVVTLRRQT